MKKFINVKTGNVVRAKNAATVALMEKSNGYKEVTGKAAKSGKEKQTNAAGSNPDNGNAAGGNPDNGNAQ